MPFRGIARYAPGTLAEDFWDDSWIDFWFQQIKIGALRYPIVEHGTV
jgi:hypothetical protein